MKRSATEGKKKYFRPSCAFFMLVNPALWNVRAQVGDKLQQNPRTLTYKMNKDILH